jgi:hypothetical protein
MGYGFVRNLISKLALDFSNACAMCLEKGVKLSLNTVIIKKMR